MEKPDQRVLREVHHLVVTRDGDKGFVVAFHGTTRNGNVAIFKVVLEFWILVYLIRELRSAWGITRTNRLEEIARIDAALPEEK